MNRSLFYVFVLSLVLLPVGLSAAEEDVSDRLNQIEEKMDALEERVIHLEATASSWSCAAKCVMYDEEGFFPSNYFDISGFGTMAIDAFEEMLEGCLFTAFVGVMPANGDRVTLQLATIPNACAKN